MSGKAKGNGDSKDIRLEKVLRGEKSPTGKALKEAKIEKVYKPPKGNRK